LSYNVNSVRVTLNSTGVNSSSDSNINIYYGSIFAYNNKVYVLYSNANNKLFLSILTFSTSLSFTSTT